MVTGYDISLRLTLPRGIQFGLDILTRAYYQGFCWAFNHISTDIVQVHCLVSTFWGRRWNCTGGGTKLKIIVTGVHQANGVMRSYKTQGARQNACHYNLNWSKVWWEVEILFYGQWMIRLKRCLFDRLSFGSLLLLSTDLPLNIKADYRVSMILYVNCTLTVQPIEILLGITINL